MGYVIATDSRKRDETLFMVDRAKQRKSFWSNRTDDALIYSDIGAAQRKAASLRHNNPRVLRLTDARRIDREREREELYRIGMDAAEDGWDGHKGVM